MRHSALKRKRGGVIKRVIIKILKIKFFIWKYELLKSKYSIFFNITKKRGKKQKKDDFSMYRRTSDTLKPHRLTRLRPRTMSADMKKSAPAIFYFLRYFFFGGTDPCDRRRYAHCGHSSPFRGVSPHFTDGHKTEKPQLYSLRLPL